MFKGWRSHYLDFLSGSAYMLLGGFALQISEARAWIVSLLLVAGIGLIAWIASYRRMRTIADLPTSRIASQHKLCRTLWQGRLSTRSSHRQSLHRSTLCVVPLLHL